MPTNSNVICIGPYKDEIKDHLDYDGADYGSVPNGTPVISTLFYCNTTNQSRQLAEALGCDPMDHSTHPIIQAKVDWAALRELSEEGTEWEEDHITALMALLMNGFVCIFQPNG